MHNEQNGTTAIINAKIFDGERLVDESAVVLKGQYIQSLGEGAPTGATVVDARGATLMPGLIDSHVHTDIDGLRDALAFGITTELEMQGHWTKKRRKDIAKRHDIADLRSSGMGITPPGGHPSQYMASSGSVLMKLFFHFPFVSTPDEAVKFVDKQVAGGADYIKIFIEDGTAVGFPGLKVTSDETLLAAVREAHLLGKLAIAHVTTFEGAQKAITGGVDG